MTAAKKEIYQIVCLATIFFLVPLAILLLVWYA